MLNKFATNNAPKEKKAKNKSAVWSDSNSKKEKILKKISFSWSISGPVSTNKNGNTDNKPIACNTDKIKNERKSKIIRFFSFWLKVFQISNKVEECIVLVYILFQTLKVKYLITSIMTLFLRP